MRSGELASRANLLSLLGGKRSPVFQLNDCGNSNRRSVYSPTRCAPGQPSNNTQAQVVADPEL